MLNGAALLVPLLNKGIRLLAYGDDVCEYFRASYAKMTYTKLDGVCNYMVRISRFFCGRSNLTIC